MKSTCGLGRTAALLSIVLWVLLSVLLSGCATAYRPTPYWTLHETNFRTLKPGVATKDEVRTQIGIPLTETYFPRQNEDVWEYRYLQGTTVVMLAYLHFDPNGVYTFSDHFLDPAYHGGAER